MEQLFAERQAREQKIDVTQVVREYWEVTLLHRLLEHPGSRLLVFKGGTALRLAYGSPRFSEDLDFSLLNDELGESFKDMALELTAPFPAADVTDLASKRWTHHCEIRISETYLAQPFRIKLEISRRPVPGYQTELRLITSPSTPLQVLCRVATLEQLYRDKQACLSSRAAPKDIFDIWFISQKLGLEYRPPATQVSAARLKRELSKYFPSSYRNVIEGLL